jgi:hypothetical protein
MSTAVLESECTDAADYAQYRALSAAAVATLVVGILSLMAFLHPWFVVLPIVGIVLGIVAVKKIRANAEELTGEVVARAGMALSLLFGIAGPSYQAYVYATEVPDWAQRISYAQLQPDENSPGLLFPRSALALDGKKVFIKGYIYPGQQTDGIKQFLLCRDRGDCCFGGNPKITDRIQVTLADPLTVSFSSRQFKVAGTFRVEPTKAVNGIGAVLYHLDAEYVQ